MRRWRHSLVIEKRNERACNMRSMPLMAIPLLLLFTESLAVRFAVRIEEFLAALLPRRFEFGRCDVPVRSAFLGNGAQILAEIFQSGQSHWPRLKKVASNLTAKEA
jgi:cytochrome bd-type quinol oxidase subunit 2